MTYLKDLGLRAVLEDIVHFRKSNFGCHLVFSLFFLLSISSEEE